MNDIALYFVLPIGLALVVAVASGRFLKRQPKFVLLPFRALLAGLSPLLTVLLYFWAWQRIDHTIHQSSGGGDYMGPMTMLVYGGPIFGFAIVLSMLVAAFVFAEC